MSSSISPKAQAAEMRAKAATLTGADREHYLWLAAEWDRTAARFEPHDRPEAPRATLGDLWSEQEP